MGVIQAIKCSIGWHSWNAWDGTYQRLITRFGLEEAKAMKRAIDEGSTLCFCHECWEYKLFPKGKVPHGVI